MAVRGECDGNKNSLTAKGHVHEFIQNVQLHFMFAESLEFTGLSSGAATERFQNRGVTIDH